MDVFKKALLCVSLLLISSNAFSTAYYLDNYYYKRINNSHAEFDTKEEASENGCALYSSYSYDINIDTYYSDHGPLAGLVYTYNTTCLNHPYPDSRGWTIHTDYHVCPAATEGNAEYDEIGCGCSGDGTESLFDGEEGGEEGCKPTGAAGSGGTGSGSGGNNGGNGGDGQDPNNPDGPDGEGPDKTGGCKKGDAESDQTDHPCQISTGAKFRNEVDFTSSSLSLVRHYNSLSLVDRGFGKGWHSAYFKQLEVTADSLTVFEGNGRGETWTKVGDVWQGDADSDYLITETSAGYTVTLKRGDVHEYNLAGLLLSETDTQGKVTTYGYDAQDRLTTVTHYYGQSITFEYSTDGKNHITKVTDTSGVEYGYEYDANDNLIAVIYPGLTSDTSDNPRRIYHYEDSRFPNNVTGITNVDGDRYATFSYNADGRAIESALAPTTNGVGQERVQLNYSGQSRTVTDAIGTQEQWTFDENLGVQNMTSRLNLSDGKGIYQTWDANNNLTFKTDAEGRISTYTYNASNQLISRTRASGTLEERTSNYEYVSADIDIVTKTINPSISSSANNKEVITTYDSELNATKVEIAGFTPNGLAVSRAI